MMQALAAIPLLISAVLWLQFLYSWRKTVSPMWNGKCIPLRAVIVKENPGRILGGEYRFTYQGEEISQEYTPPGQYDGLHIGSKCYIYFNPAKHWSFLGIHREVKPSGIIARAILNCLPLLAYLLYFLMGAHTFPLVAGQKYVIAGLVLLLPLSLVVYNFPRWRQCKHFKRSSWSMLIDAEVVERREISAKKDRLFYRSTDPENPFTGEATLKRHPMRYDTGDLMPVYYNTQSEKTMPQFLADKKHFAHWGVFVGLFLFVFIFIVFYNVL